MSNLEERFSDLDYPGRKKPTNREPQRQEEVDTGGWDSKPVYYLIKGEKREFFLISHLAHALGYSVQSIRAWEAQGLLAKTPYRSPSTRRPVAGGRSTKGRRLWTREQVEGILRIAKRHKVILPDRKGNKNPPTPAFAYEVGAMFASLAE